jgi:arabinose-5-phosphate isomerase
LANNLSEEFDRAVDLLAGCAGKVVLLGMGKSGIVAKKTASTLASTGTPAIFLHPAEAMHGDLGMLSSGDIALIITSSGETPELIKIIPVIKDLGASVIAICGEPDSTIGRMADLMLPAVVAGEACPLGLIPTASTAVSMALGDALAICLMRKKGIDSEEILSLHPGGNIGQRLFLKVGEIMHTGEKIPRVQPGDGIRTVLSEMTAKKLGITTVMNSGGELCGVITDGDLRRAMESADDISELTAEDIMTRHPKTVGAGASCAQAVGLMEKYQITVLLIVEGKQVQGIVHIHDILGKNKVWE